MTSGRLSSRRKDATANDEACTICAEVYRDPRLLPCRHTFCSGCLEKWHASSGQRHCFSCPICREEVWLPELGVQGFSPNYFVPCKLYKENCSVCQMSSVDVRPCISCDQLLCQTCRTSHGSSLAGKGGSCCEKEEEIVPAEATAIRTAISTLRPVTRSCCYAEVIGGFQSTEGGGNACVSKIVPVSAREAWVLFDYGPAIYRYNISGKVTEIRYAAGKVIDMCAHPDGPLLVIQEYSSSVFVCGDNNTTPIEYVNVGDYLPTSLLVKHDGSIIVAVKTLNDSLVNECVLLEFDHERNQRRKRTLRGRFMRISGLACDAYSCQVCTADMECRAVNVLPNNTTRVLEYQRSSAFPIKRQLDGLMATQFTPRAVCSGLRNAFLVLDGGSGYIHVLDTSASLISVVVMDDQEQAGSPHTIAVGQDDRLWVGDASDGKVKIYNLNIFLNHFNKRPVKRVVQSTDRPSASTGELFGSSSGGAEHFPKTNSPFTAEHLLAVDMDGSVHIVPEDTVGTLARNCMAAPPIRIKHDFNGVTIALDDTGTPEGNVRERERVLNMIRENDVIRNKMEHVCNVDHLGPANVKFESTTNGKPQRFPPPYQPGSFSTTPSAVGSSSLQYGQTGVSFLTGNRQLDMKLLGQFLEKNPAIRDDMERKGITLSMIVDFPNFLKGHRM